MSNSGRVIMDDGAIRGGEKNGNLAPDLVAPNPLLFSSGVATYYGR